MIIFEAQVHFKTSTDSNNAFSSLPSTLGNIKWTQEHGKRGNLEGKGEGRWGQRGTKNKVSTLL